MPQIKGAAATFGMYIAAHGCENYVHLSQTGKISCNSGKECQQPIGTVRPQLSISGVCGLSTVRTLLQNMKLTAGEFEVLVPRSVNYIYIT